MYRQILLTTFVMLFVISCGGDDNPTEPEPEPTTGAVEVATNTTGDDIDSDGYTVTAGNQSTSISASGTAILAGLSEGDADVELSGIADNCSVSGDNPKNVSVTAGDTTSSSFDVSCQAVANNQIAFISERDGDGEIFLMNVDGSDLEKLTDNMNRERDPVISNDGTKIVFQSDRSGKNNIYTMNVDGSDVQRISSYSGTGFSWSPDDSHIAFTGYHTGDGNGDIFIIDADGSNEQQLTNESGLDFTPNWSPDGNRIAFSSDRDGDHEIYTMGPDGSNLQQITSDSGADPQWSPDGSKIAFVSGRHQEGAFSEIYTMNADGTELKRITNNTTTQDINSRYPSWSPDGNNIVFASERDGNYEIYTISADGSGTANRLTNDPDFDGSPSWSPIE